MARARDGDHLREPAGAKPFSALNVPVSQVPFQSGEEEMSITEFKKANYFGYGTGPRFEPWAWRTFTHPITRQKVRQSLKSSLGAVRCRVFSQVYIKDGSPEEIRALMTP